MLIRNYIPGEEAILREVFHSSVHQLARAHYTPEQINAWAPESYDRQQWAERIAGIHPFVAIVEGRIAGYCDLQSSGYIDHFFVAGEFSGKGVGTALMLHIHETAVARNIQTLFADVSLSAEGFFARNGFAVEVRKSVAFRGVSMSHARMAKPILGVNAEVFLSS